MRKISGEVAELLQATKDKIQHDTSLEGSIQLRSQEAHAKKVQADALKSMAESTTTVIGAMAEMRKDDVDLADPD